MKARFSLISILFLAIIASACVRSISPPGSEQILLPTEAAAPAGEEAGSVQGTPGAEPGMPASEPPGGIEVLPAPETGQPSGEGAGAGATEPGAPAASLPLTMTQPSQGQEPVLCTYPQDWAPYTVQASDNLDTLAEMADMTGGDLATSNCLSAATALQAGMQIYLPATVIAVLPPPVTEPGMPSATAPLTGTQPTQGQETLLCAYPQDWVSYTVQEQDSLESLAALTGLAPGDLATSNCLYGTDPVPPGTVIYLPPAAAAEAGEAASETAASESAAASGTGGKDKPANCKSPIKVRSGEWVYKIARRCNISPYAIIAYNRLPYPYWLRPGQTLYLPPNAPPFPGK